MGLWDAITGRRRTPSNGLDALFALPTAAITLETAAGFKPTGQGSVCYRAAEGGAAASARADITALLDADADGPAVETSTDGFGFTWLTSRQSDMTLLCNDLHAVNTVLEEQGFGPALLCSLVPFVDDSGRQLGLVYLYKQGTFYPFSPTGEQSRDNMLEIQIRDQLAGDLPIESELSRWLALWGAPGLG